MVGMLQYAAAGALKGLGLGIQEDVKQNREAALKTLELQAAQQRSDNEIAARHQDVATEQTGATTRNTATITAENQRNTDAITGRAANVTAEQEGANARNKATITGENQRKADELAMLKEKAKNDGARLISSNGVATFVYDDGRPSVTIKDADGKPTSYEPTSARTVGSSLLTPDEVRTLKDAYGYDSKSADIMPEQGAKVAEKLRQKGDPQSIALAEKIDTSKPMPASMDEMVDGDVYRTSKGLVVWNAKKKKGVPVQ